MKKLVTIIFTIAILVTALCLIPTKVEEVHAEETVGCVTEKYSDLADTNNPTKEGYLFAGWFSSEECTLDTAITDKSKLTNDSVAKFVPEDVLQTKLQLSTGTVTDQDMTAYRAIRLVSSVDSLNYRSVGFIVNGTSYDFTTVFRRIDSTMYENVDGEASKLEYSFGPKIMGAESEYFFTAKMAVSESDMSKNYTVQAYWTTLDGTIVKGQSRSVIAQEDVKLNIINMTVNQELAMNGVTYTAAFESKANKDATAITETTATVEVLAVEDGYSNIRITLTGTNTKDQLASATQIIIKGSDGSTATVVHRNYYTTHMTTTGTPHADTSWYDVFKETETEFTIATTADLYGFAQLVTDGTFGNAKAYLCADMVINDTSKVTNPEEKASWAEYTADYAWTPAGSSSNPFSGTFDGDEHSISGIYISTTDDNVGLFGSLGANANVESLKMTNSYISGGKSIGSIVGSSFGNLKNIESNAVVCGTQSVGGLVGQIYEASEKMEITECSYGGELTSSGINAGGIVGFIRTSEVLLKNCISSGKIKSTVATAHNTATNVGGFVGYVEVASTLDVQKSSFTGDINEDATISGTHVGGAVGQVNGSTININKVYVGGEIQGSQMTGGLVGTAYSYSTANSIITMTDCHMNGTVKTANTGHQNAGGLIGYANGTKSTPNVTIKASKCLITGKMSFVEGKDHGCILVGKLQNYASLTCESDVYYVNDAGYHVATTDTNANYLTHKGSSLKGTVDVSLAKGMSCNRLSGTNAITNATGLDIVVEPTGENTWVATKTGFPMLQIFADTEQIFEVEENIVADTTWYDNAESGVGESEDNPYKITNAAELLGLASLVNGGNSFDNKFVRLEYDVYCNINVPTKLDGWKTYEAKNSFVPIGTASQPFNGQFDGNDCMITGLHIVSTSNGVGLFGALGAGSTVKDLKLDDSFISGGMQVGGIAGNAFGNITNVECNAVVYGTQSVGGLVGQIYEASDKIEITNCSYAGEVYSTGINAGGIVAFIRTSDVSISGCTANGAITSTVATAHGTAVNAGGLVGYIEVASTMDVLESSFVGTVDGKESTPGKHIGGIVGQANGSTINLNKVYVAGEITASQMAGGMVGAGYSYSTADCIIKMTDCHVNGTISTLSTGHQNAGGLIGYAKGTKSNPSVSIEAARCLMTGQLQFVEGKDYGCTLVGKLDSYADFTCTGSVYYINDADYHTAATGDDGAYLSYKQFTTFYGTVDATMAEGLSVVNLTGSVAVEHATGLVIDGEESAWVSTTGFPTLRIFANAVAN